VRIFVRHTIFFFPFLLSLLACGCVYLYELMDWVRGRQLSLPTQHSGTSKAWLTFVEELKKRHTSASLVA
jgi:hypothetical protein